MEEFFTYESVENIYFSDHDAVRKKTEKNTVEFSNISQNSIRSS